MTIVIMLLSLSTEDFIKIVEVVIIIVLLCYYYQ
jgi:hypothetical protein